MSTPTISDPVVARGWPVAELPTLFQQVIHKTHYARWSDELARREDWHETVYRGTSWMKKRAVMAPNGYELTEDEERSIYEAILYTQSMCSMRLLMTAGAAADRDNVAIFNCTYVALDDVRAFDEAMYLLMCGTGVGYSVERQLVKKLPSVPEEIWRCNDVIVVEDNRKSWAASYRRLIAQLYAGHEPKWDVSQVRAQGEPLKTFGGRASGPAPLVELFKYTIDVFRGALGRKLNSIECHGLMCKIGDIVVSGGVRRSALISISNPSDERMRDAKSGDWRDDPMRKHYQLANNSAAWTEKPDVGRFMSEWIALYKSHSGERGILNREALVRACEAVGRKTTWPDGTPIEFGVNPCGEIILRPEECCNLTEIVARSTDSLEDLKRKAIVATIMGTIQASCTDFNYVRPIWKKNCDEEALLGVSITGELDHPVLANWDTPDEKAAHWKQEITRVVRETNAIWAEKLGINVSAMVTCQKPSGTVSSLVDSSAGGHARFAPHYVRRTRVHNMDPVAEVLVSSGVPWEQDAMKPENIVFEWPVEAPKGAKITDDMSAVEQLERWLHTKTHFTEHNPSCTIQIGEDEWLEAGAWVYAHFDEIGGLAFNDRTPKGYTQMPYEAITEEEYVERWSKMPDKINWDMLSALENGDNTTGSRELSCMAGNGESCDIA